MNVDNILSRNRSFFNDVLEQLENKTVQQAKSEIERRYEVNKVLYEAIEFTIKQLDEEENILSKILYKSFGIGREKNERRTQLVVLGGHLKAEISQIEREKYKITFHLKNLFHLLENLKRLSDSFSKRTHSLRKIEDYNRCREYLKEVYLKTDEVTQYKKELDVKMIYLESCRFKYEKLLKQIPRHRELTEDSVIGYIEAK
jgi:hypothetical protein